jgi:hypothetical protein
MLGTTTGAGKFVIDVGFVFTCCDCPKKGINNNNKR